jgi:signal transduction histidine kinase
MRRRSLRTRLMLLYAVPFFLTGAALLAIPILQTKVTEPVGGQGIPDGEADMSVQPLLLGAAVGLVVMAVVALLLGWLIAGRFLRPLRTMTSTARAISASNLHQRLGPTGHNDEFTELAETLDDLFERLEASFASQRHFVANASHELRTPLTAERTLLQVALADPAATTETLRATCQDVLALGAAQERLVDSLLTLASSEQGIEVHEPFDLAEIARTVVHMRQSEAAQRGITISTTLGNAPATGDPDLAESLVANLVDNALRHNISGGRLELKTESTYGHASVTVSNTGPVVPPDEVDRLFQPFQRLRGQRVQHTDGHGLGLAIVRAIAGAHHATLLPQARSEGGLDIQVIFPATR